MCSTTINILQVKPIHYFWASHNNKEICDKAEIIHILKGTFNFTTVAMYHFRRSLQLVVLILYTQSSASESWVSRTIVASIGRGRHKSKMSLYFHECTRFWPKISGLCKCIGNKMQPHSTLDQASNHIMSPVNNIGIKLKMEVMQSMMEQSWNGQFTTKFCLGFSDKHSKQGTRTTIPRKCCGIWTTTMKRNYQEKEITTTNVEAVMKFHKNINHFVISMLSSLLNIGTRFIVIFKYYHFHSLRPPDNVFCFLYDFLYIYKI